MFYAYITGGDRINILPQEFSAKLPRPYSDLSAFEYDLWVSDISNNIAHKLRERLGVLRPGSGHVPQA